MTVIYILFHRYMFSLARRGGGPTWDCLRLRREGSPNRSSTWVTVIHFCTISTLFRTLHDGDVHCSPPCPGHAGRTRAMGDWRAASTWHHASPEQNTHVWIIVILRMSRNVRGKSRTCVSLVGLSWFWHSAPLPLLRPFHWKNKERPSWINM